MQFHLTQEQVPAEIQWLSELVGMERFLQILDTAGGECIYFPKRETLERGGKAGRFPFSWAAGPPSGCCGCSGR